MVIINHDVPVFAAGRWELTDEEVRDWPLQEAVADVAPALSPDDEWISAYPDFVEVDNDGVAILVMDQP